MKRIMRNEICPMCDSNELDFGSMEVSAWGDQVFYPYTCLDCKFEGKQWENLVFAGHTTEDGKEIEGAIMPGTESKVVLHIIINQETAQLAMEFTPKLS